MLGLRRDVAVRALSPDADSPGAELSHSVDSLLRTFHFSDLDLHVTGENLSRPS